MLDGIHPNILALCCATLIAFARVSQRYAIPRMKMHTANLVMACVTTTLGWFFYWIEGPLDQMPYQGVFWFMAMGLFGSFLGRYINFIAIRYTGLARAAVMSQTVLVWSSVLAVFILGEVMSPQKGAWDSGRHVRGEPARLRPQGRHWTQDTASLLCDPGCVRADVRIRASGGKIRVRVDFLLRFRDGDSQLDIAHALAGNVALRAKSKRPAYRRR